MYVLVVSQKIFVFYMCFPPILVYVIQKLFLQNFTQLDEYLEMAPSSQSLVLLFPFKYLEMTPSSQSLALLFPFEYIATYAPKIFELL